TLRSCLLRICLLVLLIAIGLAVGGFVCLLVTGELHAYRVPTGGMKPTVQPGDMFFSERTSYRFRQPRRGDIVVFTTKGIPSLANSDKASIYVKRVIGLPGDTLEMHLGDLLVNGKPDPALATLKMVPGHLYLTE